MLFNAVVSVANVFQHRKSWEGDEDELVGMDWEGLDMAALSCRDRQKLR